ncbi:MAG: response regulator [Faecalibacterium sp.]
MKDSKNIQTIRIAVASYDASWLRVVANYLQERKEFSVVDCYARGKLLLEALSEGVAPDVVIVDEQMQDVDLFDFMQTYASLHLSNHVVLLGLCNKRYLGYTGNLLSLGLTDFMAKPIQLSNLTERILQLHQTNMGGRVKDVCESLYVDWKLEINDSCHYLTDAVRIANDSAEKLAIGKEIVWNVAELHGSTPHAVDSALRRLVEKLECGKIASYLDFKSETGLGQEKPTVKMLVYAIKYKLGTIEETANGNMQESALQTV